MNNPCNECLIKVNCTQVCPAKENLKTLLVIAIKNFRDGGGHNNLQSTKLYKQYRNYDKLLGQTRCDIAAIKARLRAANV